MSLMVKFLLDFQDTPVSFTDSIQQRFQFFQCFIATLANPLSSHSVFPHLHQCMHSPTPWSLFMCRSDYPGQPVVVLRVQAAPTSLTSGGQHCMWPRAVSANPCPVNTQMSVFPPGWCTHLQMPPLVVIHSLLVFTARVLKILSPERKSGLESLKVLKNDLYWLKA